jgi:hypothetical protein
MKKTNQQKRLTLSTEKVRQLQPIDAAHLKAVAGGAPCDNSVVGTRGPGDN